MKRNLCLFATMLFVLLFFLPFPSYSAPRAVVQDAVYDAGEIPQGKEISHEFIMKNTGNEQLTFKVKPC